MNISKVYSFSLKAVILHIWIPLSCLPSFLLQTKQTQILQPLCTAHVFQTSDHRCPPHYSWITEPKIEFRAPAVEQNYHMCLTDNIPDISAGCLPFLQCVQCQLYIQCLTKTNPDPSPKLHCLGIHPSPFSVALIIPPGTEFCPHWISYYFPDCFFNSSRYNWTLILSSEVLMARPHTVSPGHLINTLSLPSSTTLIKGLINTRAGTDPCRTACGPWGSTTTLNHLTIVVPTLGFPAYYDHVVGGSTKSLTQLKRSRFFKDLTTTLLGFFPYKSPSWLQSSFLKPIAVILLFSLLPFPKTTFYHFMVILHQVAFRHLHQNTGPKNLPDSLVLSWIHLPARDKVGRIPHFSFCTECSCSGSPSRIWPPLVLHLYLKILITDNYFTF